MRWLKPKDKAGPKAAKGRGRKRKPVPLLRRRVVRGGAAAALVAIVAAAAAWTWSEGHAARTAETVRAEAVSLSVRAGLVVRDVMVQGRQRTERAHLLAALGLDRGDPILGFDPALARQRIEALPWVASATVERRLPDTVFVGLVEREPLALWQRDGRFVLIDAAGEVILERGLDDYVELPLVVGEDAAANAARLLSMVEDEPRLAGRMRAAVRVGKRRWSLVLADGINIELPEIAPEAAWSRLAEYDRKHEILSKDVKAIDLRLPDRLVVRGRDEAVGTPAVLGPNGIGAGGERI